MRQIMLHGNRGKGASIFVDDGDYAWLNRFKWYLRPDGYATTTLYDGSKAGSARYKQMLVHLLLMPKKPGLVTDHINRNKLDNQRKNLRYTTHSENTRNKALRADNVSGFNCVTPSASGKRWKCRIKFNGRYYHLGTFDTAKEASSAVENAQLHPDQLHEPKTQAWTHQEDDILFTVYPMDGPQKVAELTGRSSNAVRTRACLKGIAYVGQ